MEHYYSSDPGSVTHPRTIELVARGQKLSLTVDAGVFSKRGLDYGTRVLVETVRLAEMDTVIDLGCGYGPVTAILAHVYPATRWVAVDINSRAVELARRNLGTLGSRVTVVQSDGLEGVDIQGVNAVLLNPPIRAGKAVVYRLFAEAGRRLEAEGALWLVIHKKHGAASARVWLEERFRNVSLENRESGYHVFRCSGYKEESGSSVLGEGQ